MFPAGIMIATDPLLPFSLFPLGTLRVFWAQQGPQGCKTRSDSQWTASVAVQAFWISMCESLASPVFEQGRFSCTWQEIIFSLDKSTNSWRKVKNLLFFSLKCLMCFESVFCFFLEPEEGPSIDGLSTSPKASIGESVCLIQVLSCSLS